MVIDVNSPSFPSIVIAFRSAGSPRQMNINGVGYIRNGELYDQQSLTFTQVNVKETTFAESYSSSSVAETPKVLSLDENKIADVPVKKSSKK